MMDHHCMFLGQCVGRGNFKYFIQYCLYTALLLVYAIIIQLNKWYTVNPIRQEGCQGLSWMFLPGPHNYLNIFWLNEQDGGFGSLRTLDNFVMIWCIQLASFCIGISFVVLSNIRNKTNSIEKLQNLKSESIRSNREVFQIVFGQKASLLDIILPTTI